MLKERIKSRRLAKNRTLLFGCHVIALGCFSLLCSVLGIKFSLFITVIYADLKKWYGNGTRTQTKNRMLLRLLA